MITYTINVIKICTSYLKYDAVKNSELGPGGTIFKLFDII